MTPTLQLNTVEIKHFRCFTDTTFVFEQPLVVIEGVNGSGKTSLLEALHYACYLRSFRTHVPRELMHFDHDDFFIKVSCTNNEQRQPINHTVQVGFTPKKRLVKLDGKPICSYKELLSVYRVLTITEEDLQLITGTPAIRRTFLDQALLLQDPTSIETIRALRHIVSQRNALLQSGRHTRETYDFWTHQLWEQSCRMQHQRRELLTHFNSTIADLLQHVFGASLDRDALIDITFSYRAKKMQPGQSFEAFIEQEKTLWEDEQRWGRSLFGAHLDDIAIAFQARRSKAFASRGQQKLIAILVKIALGTLLQDQQRGSLLFLLDDFMTDFDSERAACLLRVLQGLGCQLIFTSPVTAGSFHANLLEQGAQRIKISH